MPSSIPPQRPSDWSKRVRAARGYTGLGRRAFAELPPIQRIRSQYAVRDWENGKSENLDAAAARAINEALAEASGLPEWFFSVASLKLALRTGTTPPERQMVDRLSGIEGSLEDLRADVQQVLNQRESDSASPAAEAPSDAGRPPQRAEGLG